MINPLVSVCIPTFNGELFISETIACVLSQTYEPIEVIVADDGSTDRTLAIVESMLKGSGIVYKVFGHDRLGLGNNWNYCLSQAQGKYVKFLLQDDCIHPECISSLVQLFESNPHKKLGMVFCLRGIKYSDDTKLEEIYHDLTAGWTNLETINYGYNLLNDPGLLLPPLNKIGEPSNTLILRSVFDRLGAFDPNLQQLIDLDMWLRIMGHYQIGFIDRVLGEFRVHRGQFSQINSNSGNAWLDSWRLFFKMLSHPDYDFLPAAVRQGVAKHCIAEMVSFTTEIYQLRENNQALNLQLELLGQKNENLAEELQTIGKELTETHDRLIAAQSVFVTVTATEAKLQNLSRELEKVYSLYQSATAQVQLLSNQMQEIDHNLKQTQTELAASNSLVASQQATIDYLQASNEHLQASNAEYKKMNEEITADLETKNNLLAKTESELEENRNALQQALTTITAMESSKFWKLRNKWLELKQLFIP